MDSDFVCQMNLWPGCQFSDLSWSGDTPYGSCCCISCRCGNKTMTSALVNVKIGSETCFRLYAAEKHVQHNRKWLAWRCQTSTEGKQPRPFILPLILPLSLVTSLQGCNSGCWEGICSMSMVCSICVNTAVCLQESSRSDGGGATGSCGQDEEDGTRNGTSVWDEGQREAPEAQRIWGWGELSFFSFFNSVVFLLDNMLTSDFTFPPLQLQRRHEQMKKNLEAQHKELEDKRRQHEEEKSSWEAQQRILEQQKLDVSR